MSAQRACQLLAEIGTSVDSELDDDAETWGFGEAAHVVACCRRARADLAIVEARAEALVVEIAGARKAMDVAGLGVVSIKGSAKRTAWHHEDLFRVVVARALDERKLDESTGEFEPSHEAVARVLATCAHVDYWRKGELQQRGVNVDEYVTTSWGPKKVLVP